MEGLNMHTLHYVHEVPEMIRFVEALRATGIALAFLFSCGALIWEVLRDQVTLLSGGLLLVIVGAVRSIGNSPESANATSVAVKNGKFSHRGTTNTLLIAGGLALCLLSGVTTVHPY
jgi:hypothetical protein